MKQSQAASRPGLAQLKSNVEKNKKMVRKAAPVTVENKGMAELEAMGEALYQKVQTDRRRAKKSLISRLMIKA